tara:strand:- start:115 stop:552 length:438 start_codon:yes stop_codon:yes gene_type:complete
MTENTSFFKQKRDFKRVTRLFHLDEDISKILSMVVKEDNEEMKAGACSIFLLDSVSNNLILEAAVGFNSKTIKKIKMRSVVSSEYYSAKDGNVTNVSSALCFLRESLAPRKQINSFSSSSLKQSDIVSFISASAAKGLFASAYGL